MKAERTPHPDIDRSLDPWISGMREAMRDAPPLEVPAPFREAEHGD